MRIDLKKAAANVPFSEMSTLAEAAGMVFNFDDWEYELAQLNRLEKDQMQLF